MPASPVQCSVISYKSLTPTVFEVGFTLDQTIPFEAGQFLSIVIPGGGPSGRDLRRAYSIASGPENSTVELCVKYVEKGPGTSFLNGLRPGQQFKGFFPYGDFTYEAKPGRHICFISTGTGIAPFRSMLLSRHFRENAPVSIMSLLGVREENEILYEEELNALQFPGGARVRYVAAVSRPLSPSYTGFRGRVTDYLRSLGEDYPWLDTEYYLCGGSAMIDEVKRILLAKQVMKDSIHQEIYYKDPKPDPAPSVTA